MRPAGEHCQRRCWPVTLPAFIGKAGSGAAPSRALGLCLNPLFVGVDVIELRSRTLFGFADAHSLTGEKLSNLSIAFVQISRDDGVLRTDHNAGGFQADFSPMCAIMALGGRPFVRIDINRVIGTGLHAGFAANTSFGTEVDNAILALVHRGHGTDRYAGRILAVVAARNLKDAPRIGKLALLHILDPGAIDGQRYVVFRLARYRASVATDALAVINDESVSHEWVGLRIGPSTLTKESHLCLLELGPRFQTWFCKLRLCNRLKLFVLLSIDH